MRCEAFLEEWSIHSSCEQPLSRAALEHLAVCSGCRATTQNFAELDQTLRRALVEHAEQARPRAAAVAAALVAATAAMPHINGQASPTVLTLERSNAPRSTRHTRRSTTVGFIAPVATNLARWAVAAVLIAAATLLGRGQPFQATPTYADMTATVAAAMPSVTPSATVAVAVPGTPAAVSLARPAATPAVKQ